MINTYITNADLARLFQQASLVVCPYRDATQSAVVLTAYAFDKPVIATNVGGLPEYVDGGQTGELVPPRNPEMLAGAVIRILRQLNGDSQSRNAYRQAIQHKRRTGLSWETIADETLTIYEKACAKRK
jgi:glycosyltransferase involved in cell wall biosynthesis